MPDNALMDAGRLLIQMGRAWIPLTEADIERGATAVVRDPSYGREIIQSAVRYAQESGEVVLRARVMRAKERIERSWAIPYEGTCWKCGARLRHSKYPDLVPNRYLFDEEGMAGCPVQGFHALTVIPSSGT